MKVIIDKIKTKNLRCPDFEFKFKEGLNFIQMPNGGGKTTILELIKNTLSNNWPKPISEYAGDDKNDDNGMFEIAIKVGNKKWIYRAAFNFVEDSKEVTTQVPGKGMRDHYEAPEPIRTFLTPEHVDIFSFSADNLDPYFEEDKVKTAVDTFSGIKKTERIIARIEKNFGERHKGSRGSRVESWNNKVVAIDGVLKTLTKKKETHEAEIERLTPIKAELDLQLDNLGGGNAEFAANLNKLDDEAKELKIKLEEKANEVADAMKTPVFFSKNYADQYSIFSKNLNNLKLPGYQAGFFDSIAKSDSCICGTKIDKKLKKHILENKSKYLEDDEYEATIKILDAIKTDANDYQDRNDLIEELKQCTTDYEKKRQEILLFQHENEQGTDSEGLRKDQDEVDGKIREHKSALKTITESPYTQEGDQRTLRTAMEKTATNQLPESYSGIIKDIETAQMLKSILEDKEASAGNFKDSKARKDKLLDTIKLSLTEGNKIIAEDLKKIINKRIKDAFGRQQVEVEDISRSIQLKKNAKRIRLGSGAEKTITVTSFALALLERNEAEFPLIIDHPVITVMLEARKELSNYMKKSGHQVICLVINSEKEGFIYPVGKNTNIFPYLKDSYFATAARLEQVSDGSLPKDTTKSRNGFISSDPKYFKEFAIDTER